MNTSDVVAVTSRSFSKNKVLIKELKSRYKHVILNDDGISLKGKTLIEFLQDTNKVIVGLETFNTEILDQLPKLKVISKYGVGLNNLDLEAIQARNIRLGFTPGVNKRPVAELTIMLMLTALRKTHVSLANIKEGIWSQERGNELSFKTIGIIGFGHVGKLVAEFLTPFSCEVLAYDQDPEIYQVPLEDILQQSDIISIHLPLTDATKNLINKDNLRQCKDDVKIINTARGGIVNEDDLLLFLQDNPKAFGAFDVFDNEPNHTSPLFDLTNFYATSHLGSMTEEGVIAMGLAAIEGLDQNT